ncbi:hypothetical protein GW916_13375 [bacterium]|nr:hypothetical protein [bacterium]
MKIRLVLLAAVFGLLGSYSQAEMTGSEVIDLSAKSVVASGQGYKVEMCAETDNDDELLECVRLASNFSREEDYLKVQEGLSLSGFVAISYSNDVGDCKHEVIVDANEKRVFASFPWVCK